MNISSSFGKTDNVQNPKAETLVPIYQIPENKLSHVAPNTIIQAQIKKADIGEQMVLALTRKDGFATRKILHGTLSTVTANQLISELKHYNITLDEDTALNALKTLKTIIRSNACQTSLHP